MAYGELGRGSHRSKSGQAKPTTPPSPIDRSESGHEVERVWKQKRLVGDPSSDIGELIAHVQHDPVAPGDDISPGVALELFGATEEDE